MLSLINSLRAGVPSAELGKNCRPAEDALTVQLSMCSTAKFRAKIPLPLTLVGWLCTCIFRRITVIPAPLTSHDISASAWPVAAACTPSPVIVTDLVMFTAP